MGYLIENNNFSNDTYGVRSTRLDFLSRNIDTYAVELSISGTILTWAQDSFDEFEAARVNQSAEIGEKDEAFQTSQESDALLAERYQILKDILITRYNAADDKLKIYGITPRTPRSHTEIIHSSADLIEGHTRRKAAGDTEVLPDAMVDSFIVLYENARTAYDEAGLEREEAKNATQVLNNLFDADSKKLRALYNWIVAFWGKNDTRLIVLGFVQVSDQTGGDTLPAPMNLSYDPAVPQILWDPVVGATSYQVVLMALTSPDEWLEIYTGTDTILYHADAPGGYKVKVRARDANGYGDWSSELEYTVPWSPIPGD